ncbi:MAG TPA: hypothetical protein VL860_08495, partial [Planctomycetota bacterium]|nr:hypothetical protein [Planctomycetota bacterium]
MPETTPATTHPRSGKEVVDHGFLAARAKALEIAAFLDRLDRAHDAQTGRADFRLTALRAALRELTADTAGGGRAERLQLIFSDRSTEPAPTANGLSPAAGAPRPAGEASGTGTASAGSA